MIKSKRLTSSLTGISGEYFVAAELSRRGFMASITLRNNDSVDIHASNISNNKIFAIQVKTNQSGNRSWILNMRSESHQNENFFYIFVALKGLAERPEYFIVPSKNVADFVKRDYAHWIATPGKKGQAHNESKVRKFDDKNEEYLEQWKLLE